MEPLIVGSSSRPVLDLNELPALDPEPEQGNRCCSPKGGQEAMGKGLDLNKTAVQNEWNAHLLKKIEVRSESALRVRVDQMFRAELRQQTGRVPPADFDITNLEEQIRIIRGMFGSGKKPDLSAEHRSLSRLLSLLSHDRDKASAIRFRVQQKIKTAIPFATRSKITKSTSTSGKWRRVE